MDGTWEFGGYIDAIETIDSIGMQEVENFSRFYGLLRLLPSHFDRDELKRELVMQWTGNRTDHLREMTRSEYDACCTALEELTGRKVQLRKGRSTCLRLMQKLGIDTTDWGRVNMFCQDPRICGKPFGRLHVDELHGLELKLRSIARKGGLKRTQRREYREQSTEESSQQFVVLLQQYGLC